MRLPHSRWTQNLNPEQVEAVEHDGGPLLILAGAGSGKTTVLVSRTGRLIEQRLTSPERICVLTFTNKAASELKARVAHKIGASAKAVWAGTFHGFGLQFLKEHWEEADLPKKFGVIDGGDAQAIVKDLLRDHKAYEKESFQLEVLMSRIGRIRHLGSTSSLDDSIESAMAEVLAPKFSQRLRQLGVVDFDELLLKPLRMLNSSEALVSKMQSRFDFLMVDEFQDTNGVQMSLIDRLTSSHRNLAVVGDDDQSIYGWRGAEVENILRFPKKYPGCRVIRLERNYRSSSAILDMANAIIATNQDRHVKVLKAHSGHEGNKPELFVYDNETVEAEQTVSELQTLHRQGQQWRDMAVLYRSNSQGSLLEGALRHAQIPYKISGGTALFDRKEAKDTLAYIRSCLHPNEVTFRRVINLPARGIGEKTLNAIEEHHKQTPGTDFFWSAYRWAKTNCDENAGQALLNFFSFLEQLKKLLVNSPKTAEEVLDEELRRLGYRDVVLQNYRDRQAGDRRWQVVLIVGRILDGFFVRDGRSLETLERFIDLMELRDPAEDPESEKANEVQVMTLHACKGLEFSNVFLLGLEENILPHARLGQDINEERRLFYVGVTRAKKSLVLSRVRQRKRHGQFHLSAPSRFLLELDSELYQTYENGRPLTSDTRKTMLDDLMKKLAQKNPVEKPGSI